MALVDLVKMIQTAATMMGFAFQEFVLNAPPIPVAPTKCSHIAIGQLLPALNVLILVQIV
jgi:hypothetical protein